MNNLHYTPVRCSLTAQVEQATIHGEPVEASL